MNFECHITCKLNEHVDVYEAIAEARHWSTSQIERDPVLGKDSYFYLTKHNTDYIALYKEMKNAVFLLEESVKGCVVREKIELIMYDTKLKT